MNWPQKILFPSSCNGWLYVVTPSIIRDLLNAVPTAPFVFMEDTYITGILRYVCNDLFLFVQQPKIISNLFYFAYSYKKCSPSLQHGIFA